MAMTSFEEERKEVWASILESARLPDDDPERADARIFLLRHIVDTALPPSRRFGSPDGAQNGTWFASAKPED